MTSIIVGSGRTSSGLTLSSGSVMSVPNGGTALDTTILNGGEEFIFSGGAARGEARQRGVARFSDLSRLSQRQLFFVGGPPRSGTTWLQRLLDGHPEISCGGEGHFRKELAEPLDRMMAARRAALDEKNKTVFADAGGGYPLPEADDTDFLLATAILLALERQSAGKACLAIGEKTPENVFFFARLKRLFPGAKFIGMARDPRDALASAWHYFHRRQGAADDEPTKIAFIRLALPSMQEGARTMLALEAEHPGDCMIVTYERLGATPEAIAAKLFRFLGVREDDALVRDCVARASFAALSGGRPAGTVQEGAFFRKGVVGDWRTTWSPKENDMILAELGWTFPHFGWQR